MRYLDVRLAVIEVRLGESDEEAWLRHLEDHPEDRHVNIRIFNRPSPYPGYRQKEKSRVRPPAE